jgi:hypothetical protein
MSMKYALEERDGKWIVTGVTNSNGSSLHPSMTEGNPGGSEPRPLPPGHPSIPEPRKQQ